MKGHKPIQHKTLTATILCEKNNFQIEIITRNITLPHISRHEIHISRRAAQSNSMLSQNQELSDTN